jgi:Putative transposase
LNFLSIFFAPVKALSPIYRAMWKEEMSKAGLLEHIDPQAWNIPWNIHSQANHNGHSAFKYLAPYVFRVAISNSRIVSLQDRTVTFSYRKPGSSRPRTIRLDAMEFIRRFLQHVLPDGFMKVRHFGFLRASCPIHADTRSLMIVQAHPSAFKPTPIVPPQPVVACCPTCGGQMRVVMRLWTSNRGFVDTG